MAFLAQDPNEQTQDPNNPQANQVAGQGVTVGGGANTSGVLGGSGQSGTVGANSGSGGSGNSPKGTSSGSFTNLNSYVNANQGNDAQMGQAVQGTVQTAATKADQQGQQYQQGAQQQLASQTVNEDPNLVSSLQKGDTGGVDSGQFAKQYSAKYQGPQDATGFNNYGNTQRAYKDVQNYGQEASSGNTGQQQQLLQDTYGKAGQQYNTGESTLDSFILGSGQQGSQALKDIGQQYGGYGQNFQNIGNMVNQGVAQTQSTDQRTAQDVQNAAQTGFNSLQGQLDTAAGQVSTKNQAANDQYAAIVNPLNPNHLAAMKQAGLTDQGAQYLNDHNANMNQYVTGPTAYNLGDLADKGVVNNYQNLQSLVSGVAPGALTAKYGADALTAAGGSGPTFNAADLSAANSLGSLNSALGQTLAAKQAANNSSVSNLQQQLGFVEHPGTSLVGAGPQLDALSKQLGVDSGTLQKAASDGVDLTKYLSAGPQYQMGDVASTKQIQQFNQLSNLLGFGTGLNAGGTTPGFKYDANGLQAALAAAEANKPAPAPGPAPVDEANNSGRGRTGAHY